MINYILGTIIIGLLIAIIVLIVRISNNVYVQAKNIASQMISMNREYEESIKEQIRGIISTGIDMHRSMYSSAGGSNSVEVPPLADVLIKIRSAIKEPCRHTLIDLDADRLAVYLFHDGSLSSDGVAFRKITCACEKIKAGSGIKEQYIAQSGMSIDTFPQMIDCLTTNGRYTIINDGNITPTQKMFLSSKKITYSVAASIFDNKNNILGFILGEFDHEYNRDRSMAEFGVIHNLAMQIIPILVYCDYIGVAIIDVPPDKKLENSKDVDNK